MRSDSWQLEKEFVPSSLEEAAELRRALVSVGGASPTEAAGILGWLLAKYFDEIDTTGKATRARYRKVLASLNGSYPGPRRGQKGTVTPPYLRRARSRAPELAA